MSKNKKKKGMSKAAFDNVKLGASAIINNAACVELGRNKPWYGAIITALLSVVLAVLPIMINNFNVKGGDNFFGTYTYGFEEGLVHFQDKMDEKGVKLKIGDDHKLVATNWEKMFEDETDANIKWYRHINTTTDPKKPYIDFEAYFIEAPYDFASAVTDITNCKNYRTGLLRTDYEIEPATPINPLHKEASSEEPVASSEESVASSEVVASDSGATSAASTVKADPVYQSNVIIIGTDTMTCYKYSRSSTTATGGYLYTYDRSAGTDIANLLSSTVDKTNPAAYLSAVKSAWSGFLNEAYETNKIKSTWISVGIMSGVYVVFTLFMGLMIFLMTRGKSNPYRIYKFWECQKIAYWASFTPSLLAMILGFIPLFSSYAMFLYIFLFGMRLMWLAMKTLSPTAPAK